MPPQRRQHRRAHTAHNRGVSAARRPYPAKPRKRRVNTAALDVTKHGGFIPLIIAGLGALASLATGVTQAVHNKQAKDKAQRELQRHNQAMEAIAKATAAAAVSGKGLHLRPYYGKNC
jgi:hypothetical protein